MAAMAVNPHPHLQGMIDREARDLGQQMKDRSWGEIFQAIAGPDASHPTDTSRPFDRVPRGDFHLSEAYANVAVPRELKTVFQEMIERSTGELLQRLFNYSNKHGEAVLGHERVVFEYKAGLLEQLPDRGVPGTLQRVARRLSYSSDFYGLAFKMGSMSLMKPAGLLHYAAGMHQIAMAAAATLHCLALRAIAGTVYHGENAVFPGAPNLGLYIGDAPPTVEGVTGSIRRGFNAAARGDQGLASVRAQLARQLRARGMGPLTHVLVGEGFNSRVLKANVAQNVPLSLHASPMSPNQDVRSMTVDGTVFYEVAAVSGVGAGQYDFAKSSVGDPGIIYSDVLPYVDMRRPDDYRTAKLTQLVMNWDTNARSAIGIAEMAKNSVMWDATGKVDARFTPFFSGKSAADFVIGDGSGSDLLELILVRLLATEGEGKKADDFWYPAGDGVPAVDAEKIKQIHLPWIKSFSRALAPSAAEEMIAEGKVDEAVDAAGVPLPDDDGELAGGMAAAFMHGDAYDPVASVPADVRPAAVAGEARTRPALRAKDRSAISLFARRYKAIDSVTGETFMELMSNAATHGAQEAFIADFLNPAVEAGLFDALEWSISKGLTEHARYNGRVAEDDNRTTEEHRHFLLSTGAPGPWYARLEFARLYTRAIASGFSLAGKLKEGIRFADVVNTLRSGTIADLRVSATKLLSVVAKAVDGAADDIAGDARAKAGGIVEASMSRMTLLRKHWDQLSLAEMTLSAFESLLRLNVPPPVMFFAWRIVELESIDAYGIAATDKIGEVFTGDAQLRHGADATSGSTQVTLNTEAGSSIDPLRVVRAPGVAMSGYLGGGGVGFCKAQSAAEVRALGHGSLDGSFLSAPLSPVEASRLFDRRTCISLTGRDPSDLRTSDIEPLHYGAAPCVVEKLNITCPHDAFEMQVHPGGLEKAAEGPLYNLEAVWRRAPGAEVKYVPSTGSSYLGNFAPYPGYRDDVIGCGGNDRPLDPNSLPVVYG